MKTVNIHEAKTQLSETHRRGVKRRAGQSVKGAGKPVVKVTALKRSNRRSVRRLGFMAGQISRAGRL